MNYDDDCLTICIHDVVLYDCLLCCDECQEPKTECLCYKPDFNPTQPPVQLSFRFLGFFHEGEQLP